MRCHTSFDSNTRLDTAFSDVAGAPFIKRDREKGCAGRWSRAGRSCSDCTILICRHAMAQSMLQLFFRLRTELPHLGIAKELKNGNEGSVRESARHIHRLPDRSRAVGPTHTL